MNTTLLIMAAGIGSRFGTGIKQLEPVDASNHIIMDYSIHDAIEAGFNHVVFIIRKDIEKEFKEVIGDRIAAICSAHNVTVDYAFQDIKDIPGILPDGRTKPWGTGQAVLAAKKVIKTPFIVINADDYYGKEGFKAVHEYLVNGGKSCMAGFVLKNTLSDNGGVTRGICKMDENGNLTEVVETKNIAKTATGAEADGVVVDVNSLVSMNMWGLTPEFLDVLDRGFQEFFEKEVPENPLKAEYLIPIFIGELLEQGKVDLIVTNFPNSNLNQSYIRKTVCSFHDVFIANPAYYNLKQQEIALEDLQQYPILMLDRKSTTSEFLHNLFLQHQLELMPQIELSSNDLLIDLARIGLGIAFIPDYCLNRESKELFIVKIKEKLPARQMVTAVNPTLPIAQSTEEFLKLLPSLPELG